MKRLLLSLLVLGLLAGVAVIFWPHSDVTYAVPALITKSITSSATPTPNSSALDHVVIIVEENETYTNIVKNPHAPYFNSLLATSALASNYQGVTHPSLPNYVALTSGSTQGITSDCNPPGAGCIVQAKNIADTIEQSGRTWKLYGESMPQNCYANNAGDYATKHMPFLYYANIIKNPERCQSHVVPLSQLTEDLRSVSTTPNYILLVPNLCNDMHNCSVATGDAWLAKQVPAILNSPAFTSQRSLLVITWDEGTAENNHIPTLLTGSMVKQGYVSGDTQYSHYALLHTIESLWNIPPLTTNDAKAPLMTEFFSSH